MPETLIKHIEEVFKTKVFQDLPHYINSNVELLGDPIIGAIVHVDLEDNEFLNIQINLTSRSVAIAIKGDINISSEKWFILQTIKSQFDFLVPTLRPYFAANYHRQTGNHLP